MLLKKIYLKNFRNISELSLELSDFTVLLGENNIGKTNILMAIYKILKLNQSPNRIRFEKDDFYYDENSDERAKQLIIKLTFSDLNENDIAAFAEAGIDTENNEVSIKLEAEWVEDNEDAKVDVYFYRPDDQENHEGNNFTLKKKKHIPYYYIDAYRNAREETEYSKGDLKRLFKIFNKNFLKPLSVQIKTCQTKIEKLISECESSNNGDSDKDFIDDLIETKEYLESDDLDELEEKLKTLKGVEPSEEHIKKSFNSISEKINSIIIKYKLNQKKEDFQSLMNNLKGFEKIKDRIKENLSLFLPQDQIDVELGEIDESVLFDDSNIQLGEMPILTQGSGHQSSFVIALKISRLLTQLRLAERDIDNLIIAIEEPEAHTHPHLQRSIIKNLEIKQKELSNQGIDVQIIVTTHSPFILSKTDKSNIRILRRDNGLETICPDRNFFNRELPEEISEEKIKHFDKLFRIYPEIFLSRGVILVEGDTEFGAIPEFAETMDDIDLDKLGITVVNAGSINTVKFFYKIINSFSKCIAIRDDEGDPEDEDLIEDDDEYYFKTTSKDFENEIINSVENKKLIKIFIENDLKGQRDSYIGNIKDEVNETKRMSDEDIIDNIDEYIDQLTIDEEGLLKNLKSMKNPLSGSILASKLSEEEIPECYKNLLRNAKEMVS